MHVKEHLTFAKKQKVSGSISFFSSKDSFYNEHVHTGSCRDLMHAYFNSGLPEQAIAYILRDLLSALDYLHGRGIIHRFVMVDHVV